MNTITKVLRSSFLVLSTRTIIQVLQFGVTILLARLLTPADFGLVAMVLVVRGFLTIFLTIGFGQGLVQKQDTNDDHLQTIFFLMFTIGLVLFGVAWIGAPAAADFFNSTAMVPLFRLSVFGFLVGPFASIQQTMLSKQMKFYELSKINIISSLVSLSLTISMALGGWGAVSMVAGPLAGNVATLPFCYIYFPWLPKFKFHIYAFKDLFGFSWKVFATNAVEYFSRNLDNTLIGKYLGATALGFYNLSYNLMMLPLENIAFPIRSVLLPAFSEVQNDRKEANRVYCDFLGLVAAVIFPAMFGLFTVSDLFIISAYGDQWAPAIPILQFLCFSGMLQATSIPNNSILLSMGRSNVVFQMSILGLLLYAIGFIAGLPWGVLGVSAGYTIANLIFVPVSFVAVSKIAKIRLRTILKVLVSPMFGSILMSMVLKIIVLPLISGSLSSNLNLLVSMILAGLVIYLMYSKLFLAKQWRIILDGIKGG